MQWPHQDVSSYPLSPDITPEMVQDVDTSSDRHGCWIHSRHSRTPLVRLPPDSHGLGSVRRWDLHQPSSSLYRHCRSQHHLRCRIVCDTDSHDHAAKNAPESKDRGRFDVRCRISVSPRHAVSIKLILLARPSKDRCDIHRSNGVPPITPWFYGYPVGCRACEHLVVSFHFQSMVMLSSPVVTISDPSQDSWRSTCSSSAAQ